MATCLFRKTQVAIAGGVPLVQKSAMRSPFYLILLGIVLLTLALVVRSGMLASKHPDEPLSIAMRSAMAETSPQLSTQDATVIRRDFPTAYTTASGLMYINRAPGAGSATPKVGDVITANYSGRLLDGTPFDSSFNHGHPLSIPIGVGAVIKGWDEAFLTMKKGAKRTLIIPYWLAYGDAGMPPTIPARATLVFDVELLDFH
jgi:FKBP-type peptidyl-prolyl cis-trans isomerase